MDIDQKKRKKGYKIVTVLGIMFMLIPNGLMWFWGNMAVYSLSYIAVYLGMTSNLQAPWITALFLSCMISSLLVFNSVRKFFKRRWAILFGILLCDVASFSTYFAIQTSVATLTLTFGVLFGIGTGLMYANSLQMIINCADNDVGFLSNVLQGAFPAGAVIITQFVTWYTNPRNESPTFQLGQTVYFTQKDIIDRVPSTFLIFGCFSLTMHVIGFVLTQYIPDACCSMSLEGRIDTEVIPIVKNGPVPEITSEKVTGSRASGDSNSNDKKTDDYTPKQVLKTPLFYILWISFFITDIPYVLLTNYYKLYGQLWIHNDHFLSNLGVTLSICSAATKPLWGMAVDRFGVKNCLMTLSGTLAVTVAWFCFTAMLNPWLYFIATLIYASVGSAMYGCYLATTAIVFGKTHVSSNYGLLLTSSVAFNVIAPVLIEASLTHFGWYYTFLSASALCVSSLILCALKIPNI